MLPSPDKLAPVYHRQMGKNRTCKKATTPVLPDREQSMPLCLSSEWLHAGNCSWKACENRRACMPAPQSHCIAGMLVLESGAAEVPHPPQGNAVLLAMQPCSWYDYLGTSRYPMQACTIAALCQPLEGGDTRFADILTPHSTQQTCAGAARSEFWGRRFVRCRARQGW